MSSEFVYIVVGGGTAGCTAAGRLAERPKVKILVIEAGIANPGDIDVKKPNTSGKVLPEQLSQLLRLDSQQRRHLRRVGRPATYHDDMQLFSYIGKNGPIPVSHSNLVRERRPVEGSDRHIQRQKVFLHSKNVVIENGHAVGVDGFCEDGTEETYTAKHEVIVSSGVFDPPKLLMLSGIGPAETLGIFKITQRVDSPRLGQNLLDHSILPHVFRLKDGYGVDHHLLH